MPETAQGSPAPCWIFIFITGRAHPKLGDPLLSQIRELSHPRTDGDHVYWANGASLTLDEVSAMRTDETGG